MALQVTGRVADPSRIATGRRKIEVAIRRKAAEIFDKGMTLPALADFIAGLDSGLRTKLLEHGSHRQAVLFIERELKRKRLVVASFRAVGDSHNHAVLAIGIEGTQRSTRIKSHALLILDPAEVPPEPMATCNARLDYADRESGELPRYGAYLTAAGAKFAAVLNGAVSVDASDPEKPP